MKNKALIDLDWMDSEISKLRNKGSISKMEEKLDFREEKTLIKVRSKCEPVKESNEGRLLEMLHRIMKTYDTGTQTYLDYQELIKEIE